MNFLSKFRIKIPENKCFNMFALSIRFAVLYVSLAVLIAFLLPAGAVFGLNTFGVFLYSGSEAILITLVVWAITPKDYYDFDNMSVFILSKKTKRLRSSELCEVCEHEDTSLCYRCSHRRR